MKNLSVLLVLAFCSIQSVFAQPKLPALDKSPMDISFYPANYPLLKIQDKASEPLVARVIYSRPQKNNRVIFGDLVEYGKVWRLGANEATEIEFFQNVTINNTKVKKGRYTIYTIPTAESWTIIFNKELETWGSFKYDEKKDLLRVVVPVIKQPEIAETFSIYFEKTAGGFTMNSVWDDVKVSLPISL
ncbi:MAG: hypothetical protein JWQ27_1451 [Ferruginibacter sp.]|nr:hypothetical protein [Ferruginibacter sp.]